MGKLLIIFLVVATILNAATYSPIWFMFRGMTDASGQPLSGGLVYTYIAGTTTAKSTYLDYAGVGTQTNPIVLDARGINATWGSGLTKFVVKNSAGVTQYTWDNVNTSGGGTIETMDTISDGTTYIKVSDVTAGHKVTMTSLSDTGEANEVLTSNGTNLVWTHSLTDLTYPTASAEAATKGYVDANIYGTTSVGIFTNLQTAVDTAYTYSAECNTTHAAPTIDDIPQGWYFIHFETVSAADHPSTYFFMYLGNRVFSGFDHWSTAPSWWGASAVTYATLPITTSAIAGSGFGSFVSVSTTQTIGELFNSEEGYVALSLTRATAGGGTGYVKINLGGFTPSATAKARVRILKLFTDSGAF